MKYLDCGNNKRKNVFSKGQDAKSSEVCEDSISKISDLIELLHEIDSRQSNIITQ